MSDEKYKKSKKSKKYKTNQEMLATLFGGPTMKQIQAAIKGAVKPVGKALNGLA